MKPGERPRRDRRRPRGVFAGNPERTKQGRTSAKQITYSERGNIQGAQFFAVAGKVYELAKERGLGKEIPTEWFLQDIRD
jgi:hypothetical protein